MRIGIDTLFENPSLGTGGLTYIENLVPRLAELDDFEYVLYVSPKNRHLFELDRPNVRHVVCPFSKERRLATVAFEQTALPVLARRDRLDVFHAPGNVAPAWLPCASVLTVHTLHHWLRPESLTAGPRHFRRVMMRHGARRADAVIAVSDYLRTSLERIVALEPGKAVTVYLGAPELDYAAGPDGPATEIPEGATVFVSALWPYKNAEVAIRAHGRLARRDGLRQPLAIVGTGFASYEAELRELARTEGISDSVLFVGHVPQSRMGSVYARAGVLVYPSFEEYFGLPAVEAMAAGVPVIASDRASLPEIMDGAGLLVPPSDADAVADALLRVLTDEGLRQSLVERGRTRAKQFTWRRTADETAAVYRAAFTRHARSTGAG